jgi:hypothetical protein
VAALTARRGMRLSSTSAPISTRRSGGRGIAARRNASRITRLTRDRTAAPPQRRPIANVSVGCRAALALRRPNKGCSRSRPPSLGDRAAAPGERPFSDREPMSSLRTAAAQHPPPARRAHALPEAVGPLALAFVWLIRPLHTKPPV